MRKKTLSALLFVFVLSASAQENPTIALVEFFTPSEKEVHQNNRSNSMIQIGSSTYSKVSATLRKLEGFVVEALVADQRFTVVERRQFDVVEEEAELQKSEEFIDGYVVGQGKRIGADFLVLGDIDAKGEILQLTLFDAARQETSGKRSVELADIRTRSEEVRKRVMAETQAMLFELVPPKILIVKQLGGNGKKVNSVLISGGTNYGLRKGQVFFAKTKQLETVGGTVFERLATVGELVVWEVENEHFSKCGVEEGEKEIKKYLDEGTPLHCFPKLQ